MPASRLDFTRAPAAGLEGPALTELLPGANTLDGIPVPAHDNTLKYPPLCPFYKETEAQKGDMTHQGQ